MEVFVSWTFTSSRLEYQASLCFVREEGRSEQKKSRTGCEHRAVGSGHCVIEEISLTIYFQFYNRRTEKRYAFMSIHKIILI